ncbi:hypothetical protein TSUD_326660 [Trifolium subterraneum]|uniref:Uncharacterized protein n=1 Tax=Trifolium subterraneum TaxID=3900 RepID=A0A2Z6MHU7_TRISU|nr:hypothetical protein TSUD_326660 [Trifolium subterraneum]
MLYCLLNLIGGSKIHRSIPSIPHRFLQTLTDSNSFNPSPIPIPSIPHRFRFHLQPQAQTQTRSIIFHFKLVFKLSDSVFRLQTCNRLQPQIQCSIFKLSIVSNLKLVQPSPQIRSTFNFNLHNPASASFNQAPNSFFTEIPSDSFNLLQNPCSIG